MVSYSRLKYMMGAQDKSDEMDVTFNRDAATTYYLDQQSLPLSAKVLMAPPSAKLWYQPKRSACTWA